MKNTKKELEVKINELNDKVTNGEIKGDEFISKIFETYKEIQNGDNDPLLISYLLEDVLFELGEVER